MYIFTYSVQLEHQSIVFFFSPRVLWNHAYISSDAYKNQNLLWDETDNEQ